MTTKQSVLGILEQYKGESVSGSKIAQHAGVSRSAVWKAVTALRSDGYDIEAVTNKGYRLNVKSDILSAESISPFLKDDGYHITVYDAIDSTNSALKRAAQNGAPDKSAAVALTQTGGRGRRGHSFFSPGKSGLYLSVLYRPQNITAADAPVVTTAAAVAICRAVSEVVKAELEIKWINDLFYNGKKVCGILTEAATDFESGSLEYIVIGAGLNLNPPPGGFPEPIANIAGAISDFPVDKSRLTASILNYLTEYIAALPERNFLSEYKKRLFVLGKKINVLSPDGDYSARAVNINQNAELIVTDESGITKILNSGEIRLKLD